MRYHHIKAGLHSGWTSGFSQCLYGALIKSSCRIHVLRFATSTYRCHYPHIESIEIEDDDSGLQRSLTLNNAYMPGSNSLLDSQRSH